MYEPRCPICDHPLRPVPTAAAWSCSPGCSEWFAFVRAYGGWEKVRHLFQPGAEVKDHEPQRQ